MGRAEPPAGVLPLLAVISRHESAFVWAAVLLTLGDVTSMTLQWMVKIIGH